MKILSRLSMILRKMQLIAGTTYSVSLPKEWVTQNGLKEKSTLSMKVLQDKSLVIYPNRLEEQSDSKKISIDVDDYDTDIDQILFSLFYKGFEDIVLFSKKGGMKQDIKKKINKTLTNMSGTEIVYEDDKKMEINVFLNNEKLNIKQILFRVCLIIRSSINNIRQGYEVETIKINENEIDRLYHLIIKLITVSQSKPELLISSQIKDQYNLLSYFIIAKRLEHLGDNINHLVEIFDKEGYHEEILVILDFIDSRLKRNMNFLMSEKETSFTKTEKRKIREIRKKIDKISYDYTKIYLFEALKSIIHFEEELFNIYFEKKLIQ